MSMTNNNGTRVAIPHQDIRNLSCPDRFFSPRRSTDAKVVRREKKQYGESVMELRVQLKICEGCGCLWYRTQHQGSVYCKSCECKLKDFPSPESRKRRGRPCRKAKTSSWTAAVAVGGAQ
jgi:hypothetical protein